MKMLVADFDSIPDMDTNEGCVVELRGEQYVVGFVEDDEGDPPPGMPDLRIVLFEIEKAPDDSDPVSCSFREFVEQNSDKFELV